MEQRSAEWYAARLGNVTASRISDVIAKTRNGYGAARETYMMELLAERLTGVSQEHYVNDAMLWGIEQEDYARAAYEAMKGEPVLEVGYVPHPTVPRTGASPDGLVGNRGLVEIKCPLTKTQLFFVLRGAIDPDYETQMAWQLECTGRDWCDFVSYDPRLPENVRMVIKRYTPEPVYLEYLRGEVQKFLAELDELEARVRAYRG